MNACEGVTNHLDSLAMRRNVLRLLFWHFIVLEIVACRSPFFVLAPTRCIIKTECFLYICYGEPIMGII